MKKSLLIAIIIALGFNANAQRVPIFENFNNGLPPGWTAVSASIKNYDRFVNGVCTTNQGLVAGASIGSGGNNKTGFRTSPLQYVDANSIVTVRFEGYVYSGNQLRCQDQLFGTTCTGTAKIYITSATTGDTLGNSMEIPLNLTTGINTLTAQVNANVAPSTEFKVLLDISQVNCTVNGSFNFVIDNVFIAATAGGPLPVYFKSFNAKRSSAQNVLVSWITATEQNSRGFYVQRNTNGRWDNLGFVATKSLNGNSNVDLSYSFTDLNNFKGISQYRIVQVDINGAQKMSEVSIIRGEQSGGITVFPNPSFDGNATILFEDQTSARDIAIIDLTGRVVKQWTNVNNNNLKIDKLAPGYYSIRIFNRSTREQVVEKIIVNNK